MIKNLDIINLIKLKKIEEAASKTKKLLSKSSLNSLEWLELGVIFLKSSEYNIAMDCFQKCLKLDNTHYSAYTNIGVIYFKYFHSYKKAIYYFKKSIKLNPFNPSALFNLGCCYADIGNYNKAVNLFKQTISIKPDHYNALYNLSLKQLSLNNYMEGWQNYEVRKKVLNIKEEILGIPKEKIWDGKKISNDLIIHSEQGVGDDILISSLYKDLKKLTNKIIVSCDKRLIKLFKNSFPEINFIDRKSFLKISINSMHIFSFSLGQFLRQDISDFSNTFAWIKTDPLIDKKIIKKLSNVKKPKIGIAWKSINDQKKNINLKDILNVIPKHKYEIVNLQYGDIKTEVNETKKIGRDILFFEDINYKNNIEYLYSIIKECDLIITTSNVTAHFSGSLFKKTYLLLSINPLWYWGLENDSVWYPNTKIFRQVKAGDWKIPLENLKKAIDNF